MLYPPTFWGFGVWEKRMTSGASSGQDPDRTKIVPGRARPPQAGPGRARPPQAGKSERVMVKTCKNTVFFARFGKTCKNTVFFARLGKTRKNTVFFARFGQNM